MEVRKSVFTRELYNKLVKGAARYKPKNKGKIFDTYPYFIKYKRKLNTTDDLIVAISIAYSWMPTMLDIYDQSEKSFERLKGEISQFSSIKSSAALENKEREIKKLLGKLCKATNNSVVGASKVLHLFYYEHIPIFDSRVRRAWNSLFEGNIRIPIISRKNQVNCFFNYWLGILYWREKLRHSGVRRIEKKLFEYGGYLNAKNKKKYNG